MVNYVSGDATIPKDNDKRLIFQVCNDLGKWGAGFSGAVSRRWSQPEMCYRAWYYAEQFTSTSGNNIFPPVIMRGERIEDDDKTYKFIDGNIQIVFVGEKLAVVNAIAQNGIRNYRVNQNSKLIYYRGLEIALIHTANFCRKFGYKVQMPKIGAGHAGGDWDIIKSIIDRTIVGVDVDIYLKD